MRRPLRTTTPPRPAPPYLTPPCANGNAAAHHALCPGFAPGGRACECTDSRCPHVVKAREIAAELAATAHPVSEGQLGLFGDAA